MGKPPLDTESKNWRSIHREDILKEINPFLRRVFRKSQSKNSVSSKTVGILNLCSWQRKLPSEVVADIKSGSLDPYTLLDDFVGHLSDVGSSSFTIKNSVSSARRFLVFSGVQLNSDTFKDRVEMPRVRARTHDEPLTAAMLQKAFVNASPLGKRLIVFLTSTGCRVMEAIPTRYSEIDFSAKPPRIHLPESRTKDRISRYVWLTDEAIALIQEAGLKGDDFLFPSSGRGRWKNHGAMSYWNAATTFYNALRRAKLYREDEHGRSLIALHTLRKFTYTRLAAAIGKEYAQAIVGHSEFLDQSYWRVTLDELGQKFLAGQQAITIMAPPGPGQVQVDEAARHSLLKMAGYSDEQIDEMQRVAARLKPKDVDVYWGNTFRDVWSSYVPDWAKDLPKFSARILTPSERARAEESASPRVTQVVVLMKEVEGLIAKGYTFVAPLNGDKAVLKVPEDLDSTRLPARR